MSTLCAEDTARIADCLCIIVFAQPFVKRFALCYQTVVRLSVLSLLSVTLVYCGQMVGWINIKLGKEVGLGSGHIVLDGDPAIPPQKGHNLQFSAHPMSFVVKRLDGSRCHLVWR